MRKMRSGRWVAWMALALGCWSGPLQAETSAEQLGCQLREALGFDAKTLSALAVPSNHYSLIAAEATTFCNGNRETIEPLIAAAMAARSAAMTAYQSEGDVVAADEDWIEAIQALRAQCNSVVADMEEHLTGGQQTQRSRVDANRLLDTTIALLDVTSEQRTALRSAQRTRDQVLRHHKSRKDLTAVKAALEAFETSVSATLDASQETARSELASTMANYQVAAQVHDESLLD
jgi:hypothetical protein